MFIIFAYKLYYPYGGSHDIVDVFETLEKAENEYKNILKNKKYKDQHGDEYEFDIATIYDCKNKKVIKKSLI